MVFTYYFYSAYLVAYRGYKNKIHRQQLFNKNKTLYCRQIKNMEIEAVFVILYMGGTILKIALESM